MQYFLFITLEVAYRRMSLSRQVLPERVIVAAVVEDPDRVESVDH